MLSGELSSTQNRPNEPQLAMPNNFNVSTLSRTDIAFIPQTGLILLILGEFKGMQNPFLVLLGEEKQAIK